MNNELNKTTQWLNSNRLSLNVTKTHSMLFRTQGKLLDSASLPIKISDENISQVKSSKFLGTIIDENLTWKPHLKNISLKIAKNIGIINKVKSIFSEQTLLMLYFTMIYPYLSYCNSVWGSTYSTCLHPLYLLQKRIVRIITNSPFLAHTKPLFQRLKILTIYNINHFQTSCLIYDYHHGNLPQYLQYLFQQNSSIHGHNTRSAMNLHIPSVRTTLSKFALRFHAPIVWNSLPQSIKAIPNKKAFKYKIKQHLLQAAE